MELNEVIIIKMNSHILAGYQKALTTVIIDSYENSQDRALAMQVIWDTLHEDYHPMLFGSLDSFTQKRVYDLKGLYISILLEKA